MVTSRYILDWDFDHFRSRWIKSDYIRSAPVTTDYQKSKFGNRNRKNSKKSENMGCVCSSKKLTAEQIQGMSSKIVFILNYILYLNYKLYIIYLDTTFWKHKKELAEKTKFTPDEIEHWYHGFIQDCPTGKLTKVEFANIYAQFFPQGDPTAFAS